MLTPSSVATERPPRPRPSDLHLGEIRGHLEGGLGALLDLAGADAGGDLAQDEAVGGDVDDGEVGDDPVDARAGR